jgi:DNA polymerase-3 subunit epsilon
MLAYIQGNSRRQQLDMLLEIPQLVAARRVDSDWEVHVIRHGRLAAAGVVDARCDHRERIAAIVATAEGVPPGRTITASDVRETNLLRAWLEKDGVRLIEGTIASSYPSAEPLRRRFAKAIEAREQAHTLLAQERKRDYFNARGAS